MNLDEMGRSMWTRNLVVMLTGLSLLLVAPAPGKTQEHGKRTFVVGTRQAPPFVLKNEDGTWGGISIELWRAIATELQLTYEIRESDLQGLLDGIKDGSFDLLIGALTITSEREKTLDFTHPFHTTGLGIAVARKGRWGGGVRQFVSWPFVQAIATLALVLLVVGVIVWLFEHTQNPQHFERGAAGILSGFWWSAVTMTTVGYGDKVPITVGGRIVGVIWMFAALIIISGFTAAITTALTVNQLTSTIQGPADLSGVWVATLPDSTSEAYLRRRHIAYRDFETLQEGLQAVVKGDVDAMVYDAPLLRYVVTTELQHTVDVLPATFERQDYGFALPPGSPLREPINRILLEQIKLPEWLDTLRRYLGT